MSAKVVHLPATTTFTPEQALDFAKHLQPTDVIVIGFDEDDEFFVRSSRMDFMPSGYAKPCGTISATLP